MIYIEAELRIDITSRDESKSFNKKEMFRLLSGKAGRGTVYLLQEKPTT